MNLTKLQKNKFNQVLETLEYISSVEEQIRYKEAVPFVHIPIELLNQWSSYPRLIKEKRKWFTDIFTSDQILSILTFEEEVSKLNKLRGNDLEDVPEIFKDELWMNLVEKASIIRDILKAQTV